MKLSNKEKNIGMRWGLDNGPTLVMKTQNKNDRKIICFKRKIKDAFPNPFFVLFGMER